MQSMQSETQLVFVRTNDESPYLWWPALIGDSHRTIVSTFSSEEEKAKFTALYFRTGWVHTNKKVARLFGYRRHPQKMMFRLIEKEKESELILDFFTHCEKIGKSSNDIAGWEAAFSEALHYRLGNVDESMSEPLFSSPGGDVYAAESTPTMMQPLEQDDSSTSNVNQETKKGKRKLSMQETQVTSAKKGRRGDSDQEKKNASLQNDNTNDMLMRTPVTRSSVQMESPIIPLEKNNIRTRAQKNSTSPDFHHNLIISSGTRHEKEKRGKKKDSVSKASRRLIEANDEWSVVMEILFSHYKWERRKGDGLAEWYFVPGEYAHKTLDYLKQNKSLGKHYFATEDDVKRFISRKFGWKGPVSKPLEEIQESSTSATKNHTKRASVKQSFGMSLRNKNGTDNGEARKTQLDKVEQQGANFEGPNPPIPIPPGAHWNSVFSIIQYNLQLKYVTPFMSVKRKYGATSVRKIRKSLVENEDYFENDDALKDFVHYKFGWRGPPGKEHTPLYAPEIFGCSTPVAENNRRGRTMRNTNSLEKVQGSGSKSKFKDTPKGRGSSVKNSRRKSPKDDSKETELPVDNKEEATVNPPPLPIPSDGAWPSVYSILQYNMELVFKGKSMLVKKKFFEMPTKQIRQTLVENQDYFENEATLKDFAYHEFGWRGPPGKEHLPVDDIITGGRRNKNNVEGGPHLSPYSTSSTSQQKSNVSTKTAERKGRTPKKPKQSASPASTSKSSPASTSLSGDELDQEITPEQDEDTSEEKMKRDNNLNTSLMDRLNECSRNIHPSSAPKDMFFNGDGGGSNVSSIKNRLISFLLGCLQMQQKQLNDESSFLYVCGGPGTGKTSMVKYCIETISEEHKQEMSYSFVKAGDVEKSPHELLKTITRMLGRKISCKNMTQMEKGLKANMKHGPVILVIDEIDFLCPIVLSENSPVANILRWASDPSNRLVVVGISNSVGDNHARTLHQNFKIFDEIIFQPFSAQDLTAIVNKRLGDNISLVDQNGVIFASRRIANHKGDAREILKVLNDAIAEATKSLSPEQLSQTGPPDAPVVKMAHILKATKQNSDCSKSEIIAGLPQSAKTILCVASALGQCGEAWKVMTIYKLRRYCAEAFAGMEDLSLSSFDSAIELLVDSDLISYDAFDGDHDDYDHKLLKVGVQLHDVEIAIEDCLIKESNFFDQLVKHVKQKDISG